MPSAFLGRGKSFMNFCNGLDVARLETVGEMARLVCLVTENTNTFVIYTTSRCVIN